MLDLGAVRGQIVIDGVRDAVTGLTQVNEASNTTNNGLERFAVTGKQAKTTLIGLGTALGALSGLAINSSNELNKAMNTVQVQTGATAEEMEGLEQSLKNIYADNYGEDFEDIAQSMSNIKQQTELTGEALEDATVNALAMRDSFDMEVGESIRAADMMMKQFGLTSEEAYNLIAQGAQKGLNKNENLLDSVNEYSIHFKQLGLNANQMFNSFSNGAQAGVFDIDKLGDAVKEFGIRVKDGSNTTVEAFELLNLNADEMQAKFSAGGETANQAFQEVTQALINCNDIVAQNTAGVNLFGTMFEDLGVEAIAALTNVNGELDAQKDVLTSIKEIKYDDLGSAWAGIGRQLEVDLLIPFGEKLLPYLNDFSNWIAENKDEIATSLGVALDKVAEGVAWAASNLDTIIPIAGTALGALLALKTVATVQVVFTNATVAVNGLKTALTFLQSNPIILALTGIATATGFIVTEVKRAEEQQRKWNEELQKTIDLQSDLSGGSTAEIEKERNVLEAQLNEYESITDKHEELIARRDELNKKISEGTVLSGEETSELYKIDEELANLSLTYTKVNDKITEQFETLDKGKARLDAYNTRIENATKANKLLEEATTSESRALVNSALELQSAATKTELLYKEYEQLTSKTKLSQAEGERLNTVYEELVATMGSSIATYDEQKDAMVINRDVLRKAIADTDAQAEAKLAEAANVVKTTEAYTESTSIYEEASETKQELTKQEAEAALKTAEAYLVALQAQGSYWEMGETQSKINELRAYIKELEAEEKTAYKSSQIDALKSAQDKYTQEKKLGDLTLREQLARLKSMKSEYATTSENIISINEFSQSEVLEIIDNIVEAENLSTQQKIALYEDAKQNYCNTYSDKKSFTEEINNAIGEDVESLMEDVKSLTDEELESTKQMLRDKQYEYKDYSWAVEEIEKDLTSIKEEEANREIETAKETVDALITERKRLYNEEVAEIDQASQAAINALDEQLKAMETKERNEELLKKDYEMRKRIAEASTVEERKEREEEYQEWLLKLQRDQEKQALKDARSDIQQQANEAKENAKSSYDKDVQSYTDFLTLEEEKIRLRKDNEGITEVEISKRIANEYKQREEDLENHMSALQAIYEQTLPEINKLYGVDYQLPNVNAEYRKAEQASNAFISQAMSPATSAIGTNVNGILTMSRTDLEDIIRLGSKNGFNDVLLDNNLKTVIEIDGRAVGSSDSVVDGVLEEFYRRGIRLNDY